MERRHGARPQRVLIVDDVTDIRELWRLWFTYWGFSVQEARNGAEAVQKAFADPPDLILMDLWMPVLDGIEATKQLKADARTAQIPVLVLSASALTPGPEEISAAGADAFMQKPCDPDELLDHIRLRLRLLRRD